MQAENQPRGLEGKRVVAFESRRAQEMAKLIASYGGEPLVAPSMREVPLADNAAAIAFASQLIGGRFDVVIFLTGVGARALLRVVETAHPLEQFLSALRRTQVVVRGPKPAAVLSGLQVPIALTVPEPNTWRDLLRAMDERADALPLNGRNVAVQEYGASNPELTRGLAERGAGVTTVPVYQWALPDDLEPLRHAIRSIIDGQVDLALFTTSVQVLHLLRVASEMRVEEALCAALARVVVGSIGPVTSDALRERGLRVDFEPPHPKMGFLVAEAAKARP